MNLTMSPEMEAFRDEVRTFVERDYPRDLIAKQASGAVLGRADQMRNQQALQSRGWLAAGWPREFGGPGWSAVQRYLFEAELDRAGVPLIQPMSVIYVGPVIYTFGTAEQRRRWLPGILDSRDFWCQGYSEPEAGSDLASLQLRAERDGDDYILNGTKIWTSYAHWANWIFCLARTSMEDRPQKGISFICAEMASPGITVRPIVSIDGIHHLNQVEFRDVRVPVDQRIGEEGEGWHYATFLLQGERLSYAHVSRKHEDLRQIRALAGAMPGESGGTMLADPRFAARLAGCEITVEMLEISVLRALVGGNAAAPAQVSSLKIEATELAQDIAELAAALAGPGAAAVADRSKADWHAAMPLVPAFGPPAMASYLFDRAQTIYGGATEVQKNIIWRMLAR